MENEKLKIIAPAALAMPRQDVQALLDAGNGDAALVYLYALQNGGVLDADRAATELHRSDRDIDAAAARLRRMGLLAAEADGKRPAPLRELPAYSAREVARRSMTDARFQALVNEVQHILGRILSSADLTKLFGIYDELALPPEVIMLLVQHCKQETEARYGAGKNVGFAAISREAYAWFDREILTLDQADQWLKELERRRSITGRTQQELGIRDRALSPTERKYIESWIELGFEEQAIAMAADRTVTNTGGLKWKYMDSIIQSWHRMGLHTPEEIEKGDKKPARAGKRTAAEPAPMWNDDKAFERLDKLLEKKK